MHHRSTHCLPTRNICWLRYSTLPESLVLLLATSVTVNLISSSNSGKIQTVSVSELTTTTTPDFQRGKGQRRTAALETTLVTNDTSFKGSQPNESVKIFETDTVDRLFRFKNNCTTVGILIGEPALSGVDWGFLYSRRKALLKAKVSSRRGTKTNATGRTAGSLKVENRLKVKREAGAKVKKVRNKRVKRRKIPKQMRKHKYQPEQPTKSVSVNKRHRKKPYKRPNKVRIKEPTQRHHKGGSKRPLAQAQGNMRETGFESQYQIRQARDADYDDYYDSDDGQNDGYGNDDADYDYDEECDRGDEEPAEDGENELTYPSDYDEDTTVKKEKGGLTLPELPVSKKELGINSEDVSRRRSKRACRKRNVRGERRKNRKHGKGERRGMRHRGRKNRIKGHGVRPRPGDYDDLDYGDYGYDDYEFLQRTKRESGKKGDKISRAYTFSKSLGLIPALNHVRDSWDNFRMKARVKTALMKRTGARSINRTASHQLVLGASKNRTSVSGTAAKHGENHGAGKRLTASVAVKPPAAPVLIALCLNKVCANGGTCLRSAVGRIICICPTGFSGQTCDNRTDLCTSHPCQNGATCIFDPKMALMWCKCPSGFNGTLCQVDVNECVSEPCLNGARCVDHVDGFSCKCLPGFEGQRCENNMDDCLGRICANGGRCVDGLNRYRCQCRPGFFGRHCQRVSDACLRSPCFNGGECVAMDSRGHFYKCLCRSGYLGARCEIQAARCVHTWCQNGGTCLEAAGSFQCLCPPGLTGNLCESELSRGVNRCQPDVCQRHGKCVNTSTGYRCECPSKAVGNRCQFDRDACLPNPCINGGLCIPTGGPSYFCLCDQRFAGKRCQLETRSCSRTGTCENGGTCLEYHISRRNKHRLPRPCIGETCRVKRNTMKEWTVVRCVCPVMYTGPRCTVRNLPCTIGICTSGQECKEDPNNPVEGYSCIDKQRNEVALGNGTNWSKTVEGASTGQVHREKISSTAAVLFGAAMIVTIFGIAFIANGYTYCPCFRQKEDNVYLPVPTDQSQINSNIQIHLENPKT